MAATELSVYPEERSVTQDEVFLISINIDTTEDIIAAQFDVIFDPLIINATEGAEGGFLTKDGDSLIADFIELNNTLGKVEVALVKYDTFTGVTGSGSIVNIIFKALAKNGVSDINLESVIIADTTPSAVEVLLSCYNYKQQLAGIG